MAQQKPYDDPETLARLRLTGNDGEQMSYEEIADELNCSTGVISLRMNRYEDEISQFSKDDFTPDRLTSPHTDDQRDVIIGAVMEELPKDAEVDAHRRRVFSDEESVEVHVPGNYIEDSFQAAEESEYDDVYVSVYISNANEDIKDRLDKADGVKIVICRPGSAVAQFCRSDYFTSTFIQ